MTIAFTSTNKAVLQAAREYLIEKGYRDLAPEISNYNLEYTSNPHIELTTIMKGFLISREFGFHDKEIPIPITPEDYKHIIDKELTPQ